MGGGLMQLVAYGAQDIYLTGNPQITFFKVVYRRHTNFSIESIEQNFNGTVGFTKTGTKNTCTISRNGDLIQGMTLRIRIKNISAGAGPNWAWAPYLGHRLIQYVQLDIGGQLIDKHYGEWLHLWSELTLPESKKTGYNKMVGQRTGIVGKRSVTGAITPLSGSDCENDFTLNIPLQFWFCRNPGLALPLIALQYHDVKVTVNFRSIKECLRSYGADGNFTGGGTPDDGGSSISWQDVSLYVDYIYLDTDERRRFAQLTHEYLIEQVQQTEQQLTTTTGLVNLPFNHPVKELVWVAQRVAADASGEYWNYVTENTNNPFNLGGSDDRHMGASTTTADPLNMVEECRLQLNGSDRFSTRRGDYFNLVQPYYHHTRIPYNGINCYSFALRPEEHQPSGTCNFSRLDSSKLYMTLADVTNQATNVTVYAVNYNILRIQSGMGGLAYSN